MSVLASDRIVPAELPPNSTPVLHTADNVIHRYEKANERKYLEEEIAWIRAHQQREKLTKSERRISRVVAMHRVRACMPRDIVCKGWRDVGLGPLYLGGSAWRRCWGTPSCNIRWLVRVVGGVGESGSVIPSQVQIARSMESSTKRVSRSWRSSLCIHRSAARRPRLRGSSTGREKVQWKSMMTSQLRKSLLKRNSTQGIQEEEEEEEEEDCMEEDDEE